MFFVLWLQNNFLMIPCKKKKHSKLGETEDLFFAPFYFSNLGLITN
jgi:hypothetical protein